MTEPVVTPTPVAADQPVATEVAASPAPRRGLLRWWMAAGVGLVVLLGGIALTAAAPLFEHEPTGDDQTKTTKNAIPVTTVKPRKKTLERFFDQPGTLEPGSRAEVYAKVAGYLRRIYPAPIPETPAAVVTQGAASQNVDGGPAAALIQIALAAHLAAEQGPELDIGCFVRKGDVLLEVDVPERMQEVAEAEVALRQTQAELAHATTALGTFEAAVQVATAQKAQAVAEVKRHASDLEFREKELRRLRSLSADGTITPETADEKESQVQAVRSALLSGQARVQGMDAEIALATSKLAAARAELKVKEAKVEAAREAVRRASILADYCRVYAPFTGVINYRGVDAGDFVQNAASGQPRRLMTLNALDNLKVVLQVPERDALQVRPGAEASMTIDARPGWQFKGRVARIDYALEEQTRTMQVEIDLDNRDRMLIPGMYGRVTLTVQRVPNAQAIPTTAIYSRSGENFILQVINGKVKRQKVRIRFDDGKEVEVVKLVNGTEMPLDGTEELVVSNKGELGDGQRVRTTRVRTE